LTLPLYLGSGDLYHALLNFDFLGPYLKIQVPSTVTDWLLQNVGVLSTS